MKKLLSLVLLFLVSVTSTYAMKFTPDYHMRFRYTLYDMHSTGTATNINYLRLKNAVGLKTAFDKDSNYNFYVRLLNENYYYFYNRGAASDDWKINEFLFESLYFEAKNLFDNKLDIKVGRQNLTEYGETFLISDGTPMDGSRTRYFNAAKIGFKLPVFDVDVLGHAGTIYEQYLPVFNQNDPSSGLNKSNEQSLMLFGKSKFSDNVYLEPYYIYKSEENLNYYRQFHTFGSFVKYEKNNFAVRAQLAVQSKEEKNYLSNAIGGYLFVDNKNVLFNDKLILGGIYLSGGQSGEHNTTWNNLYNSAIGFIRSDALGCLFKLETGVYANWTNLQWYKCEYNINFTKNFSGIASVNLVYANETVDGECFGNGKNRGTLTTIGLDYLLTKNIKLSMYTEYLAAGDFYNKDLVKDVVYSQTEITLNF